MSKFVPVEGISKKPKRASRACEHCRWKRRLKDVADSQRQQQLKCSDERKDQACMNCIIYGTKCTYATASSPGGSGRRKQGQQSGGDAGKATSPSVGSASSSSKKRSQQVGSSSATSLALTEGAERISQSPSLMDVESTDSPSSTSFHDDLFLSGGSPSGLPGQNLLPRMANARRMAAEWTKSANPAVDLDSIGNRLDQYAQFLTTFGSETADESSEILSEETGLPPQQIANALLKAYTDGFQAGSLATEAKLKSVVNTQHLELLPSSSAALSSPTMASASSSSRGQSRREYGTSPIEQQHDLSLSMLFDPLSPHHHHQAARMAAAGMSPASSVSSFAGQIDMGVSGGLAIRDHQHHQQQVQAHQRQRQQQSQGQQQTQQHHEQFVQGTPRSVPHHLSLAIPHPHNVPQPGDQPAGHHPQGHQHPHQQQGWPQGGPNSAPPGMMHPGFDGNPFGMM